MKDKILEVEILKNIHALYPLEITVHPQNMCPEFEDCDLENVFQKFVGDGHVAG